MANGKQFDDKIDVAEILKEPTKLLIAKIYLQTLKTNGTVVKNCVDIEKLQIEMKTKIDKIIFGIGTGIVAFLIILFQVLEYFKR